MPQVSLPRLTRLFAWIGLTSLGGGRAAYRAAGTLGALVATAAMFLPTAVCAWVVARRWERLKGHPWAVAVERALAPVAIGLMASGVYTITRSAVQDVATALLAIAAGIALARRWVPAVALVLGAGLLTWLLVL